MIGRFRRLPVTLDNRGPDGQGAPADKARSGITEWAGTCAGIGRNLGLQKAVRMGIIKCCSGRRRRRLTSQKAPQQAHDLNDV